MSEIVAVIGIVGQMIAWTVVRRERWAFWSATVVTFAVLGVASVLAGAIVAGALWTGLAVWSGGVVAPFASHLVWTGPMLVWPPAAARDMVPR